MARLSYIYGDSFLTKLAIKKHYGCEKFCRFDKLLLAYKYNVSRHFAVMHKRRQFQPQVFDASDSVFEQNFTAQP